MLADEDKQRHILENHNRDYQNLFQKSDLQCNDERLQLGKIKSLLETILGSALGRLL